MSNLQIFNVGGDDTCTLLD